MIMNNDMNTSISNVNEDQFPSISPLSSATYHIWATTTTENSHIILKPFRRKYYINIIIN